MTNPIQIGPIKIGGGAPVTIQSMLNAPSGDVGANVAQARELQTAGCDIVRVAVPDKEAVRLIPALKQAVSMPVVADIHFDYRLALESAEAGADKIRINPGNIGGEDRVKQVADKCRQKGIPIRIGVNSGSLEKHILAQYGSPTPEALAESALWHASLLEKFDFTHIVLSAKSSDAAATYKTYELLHQRCAYPLHLGVTEAGTERMGVIKSAAGIGGLLLRGIGDTVRVSLTADPVREIAAAKDILRAVGLRREGVDVISCPTCGRTKIDVIRLTGEVERRLRDLTDRGLIDKLNPFTVAVMGCAVNGPGEAREADVGVAGGDGCGVIFRKGEVVSVGKIPEAELVEELMRVVLKEYRGL